MVRVTIWTGTYPGELPSCQVWWPYALCVVEIQWF